MHAMVQYYFLGPAIPVLVKPHRNAIRNVPFFSTAESTKDECHQLASKHTPSEAVMIMTNDQVGEIYLQGVGSIA